MVAPPSTDAGWWGFGLTAAALVLGFGLERWRFALPAAFVGGIAAFLALRRGERSLMVMLALLAWAVVVLFLLAEVFVGHD